MSTESDRLDEMAAFERLQRERLQEPKITKREYFAAMAMQGFCSINEDYEADRIALWAVDQADQLIAQLERPRPNECV